MPGPLRRIASPVTALCPDHCAGVVDVCLIPEVPFRMDKLCAYVAKVFEKKGHCVMCVAEGAGQDVLALSEGSGGTDASGNPILADMGLHLKAEMKKYFKV